MIGTDLGCTRFLDTANLQTRVLCADIFAQILRLIFVGIATTTTIIEGFTGATNAIEIIHGLESFTWSWLW